MTTVPTVTLNNGVTIPQVGFGVFQVPADETQRAVEAALAAGYRHIDTAAAYRNEAGVGAAIAASGIPRDELFITTKLRNGEQATAAAAFEASRQALGLEVIDLYLIHWPVPSQDLYIDAWKVFEQLYADGGARAIGVSNFLPDHLQRLLAATDIVPVVNQIEVHPTYQQREMAAATRDAGIIVEAYSPLGQGADLTDPAVVAIAEAHDATPAQVVLAWHLAAGTIVIPKSVDPQRMAQNLAAVDVTLTDAEIESLNGLEAGAMTGADPATAAFTQL